MGITGLLPVLKSITRNISLKELSGLRVAVDGYVWLHKGVYGCSKEIVQNIPTDKYVKYCMDNIKVLMEHGITPVIVFDGANLPMKQLEEEERRESREKYKAQAVEYTKQGKFNEANECYKKVVDITPAIAYRFIRELKIHGIEFIVAPYEADAQLAYLSQIGFVDAIISEDSDLLPYGASRVIYKFDKKSGTGQEILISDLRNNKELDFRSFNKDNFRHMCILSGCDYLKNIAGVGVKKAHQFVSRFKCPSRIIQAMRQVHKVPHNYENDFKRADLTFLHQWVWDPVQKKIVPLNHFEQDVNLDDFSHLGLKIDDKVGQLIAEGIINPTTKQPYECLPLDSQKPVTFMQKKPLTLTNTTQTKIIKPLKEVEYSTERKKTPLFLNKSTPPLQNTIDNQITVTSKYFNNKTLPLVPKTTPKPQILSPPTPPSNDNATNINAPSAPPFKKPRSFITRTDKKSLSYQHDSQMNSTQKLETIKNLNARFDCEMRELEYIDSNSTSPIEIREYHLKQQQCSGRVQFNMSTKSVSPPQYNLIQLSDEENIRELDEENDYDNDNDNDNDCDNDNRIPDDQIEDELDFKPNLKRPFHMIQNTETTKKRFTSCFKVGSSPLPSFSSPLVNPDRISLKSSTPRFLSSTSSSSPPSPLFSLPSSIHSSISDISPLNISRASDSSTSSTDPMHMLFSLFPDHPDSDEEEEETEYQIKFPTTSKVVPDSPLKPKKSSFIVPNSPEHNQKKFIT
uniref:Exonuclease 1 n=1 Tax=Arcella intermedia TaxID=1963864 RepID=A0A6B2KYW9_9EUKA|eukprot:TRINITY_DN9934_c0_g1_i7.p1 TRINITY_DN9934_c0_g1~~TRINITY_DN9934_c0_g1_i7.p1  ORF type:complete len:740 (-),score=223.86 TRINITY_DN9934_c0_g1_i7:15-2234(-)